MITNVVCLKKRKAEATKRARGHLLCQESQAREDSVSVCGMESAGMFAKTAVDTRVDGEGEK